MKAQPKKEVKINFAALAGGMVIIVCALYGLKYNNEYSNLVALLVALIGAYLVWRS